MPITDRKLRVFLCHASQDKPVVRELYQRLRTEGWIDPWLDEEKLLPGQDWDMEIEKAVEDADAVIVCLSKNSVTKEGYVQKELRKVLDKAEEKPEGTIFIIPLRFDNCGPPRRLRFWQYMDYFPPDRRNWAYLRLLQSLSARANSVIRNPPKIYSPTSSGHRVYIYGTLEFVKVPKGKFLMGSLQDSTWAKIEKPQHTINIPYDYWIGQFPVTIEQFGEFMIATHYGQYFEKGWEYKLKHPAVNISWEGTESYLDWLNSSFGHELPRGLIFRLPTEAEWEKAARGLDGRDWPWGNSFKSNMCNSIESRMPDTTPVGMFSPQGDSPYGCSDMAGNVNEWTNSKFVAYPYDASDGREIDPGQDPRGRQNPDGSYVIDVSYEVAVRGGSFFDDKDHVRVAHRKVAETGESGHAPASTGFRIAVAPPIGHMIKLMKKQISLDLSSDRN